ncbi:signal peptidase I [Candidatus Woesearchaeota archaeon]|nr:signal peptidase I [Candidatus Woesearchaeota archaeon]
MKAMKPGKAKRNTPKRYKKSTVEMNFFQRAWHFIWYDDSALSWIANILIAFILIKFIVYPLLGLALGSELPVVAVITSSMDHQPTKNCLISTPDGQCLQEQQDSYLLCTKEFNEKVHLNKDEYWLSCGDWYEDKGITKDMFFDFPLKNGFKKGDVIVLTRATPEKLDVGDVLVFHSDRPYPIIHRIVAIQETTQGYVFTTKGDHNADSINRDGFNEVEIYADQLIGRGVVRIPFVGYLKLFFVDFLRLFGITAG